MKCLIAYYSRRGSNYANGGIVDLELGNTEVAAGMIQALAGGELFRIDTLKDYPSGYEETTQVAQEELRQGARPGLKERVAAMEGYDVVILGYPNWWGTMPMAVHAFLEAYDFKGKTILPFCTHEGSGMGHSEADIRKLCPTAKLGPGLAIQGSMVRKAEGAISAWLGKAGIAKGPRG